jgi:hypothetical protein
MNVPPPIPPPAAEASLSASGQGRARDGAWSWGLTKRSTNARRLAALLVVGAGTLVVATLPLVVSEAEAEAAGKCRPQKAKSFLIRASYMKGGGSIDAKMHQRSIKYRTLHYGYVEGFGSKDDNEHPPTYYSQATTFFGLPIKLNRKVVPSLKCVEAEIHRACRKTPYEPKGIGGYRDHNTYRGGEITNHLYGIAMDIDVGRNPCCGCVEPWPDHPLCKNKSIWDKTSMPKCFIDSFEKYGWYWLGRDKLEDTMHFEFLGDPKPFGGR